MDATNANEPQAGGQLSGDSSRQAAIKRLKKLSEAGLAKEGAGQPPTSSYGTPPTSK